MEWRVPLTRLGSECNVQRIEMHHNVVNIDIAIAQESSL